MIARQLPRAKFVAAVLTPKLVPGVYVLPREFDVTFAEANKAEEPHYRGNSKTFTGGMNLAIGFLEHFDLFQKDQL